MKGKRLIPMAILLALTLSVRAQNKTEVEFFSLPEQVTDEYIDSVHVEAAKPNNYWMLGVYGGVSLLHGNFNPIRPLNWQVHYPVYGFSIVRYFSMFGLFPNMGVEFGFQQNYEGYEFRTNEQTGNRFTESGAYKVSMRVPEGFFLSHFHYDVGEHFKLIAKLGLYGGYRMDITRVLDDYYAENPNYQAYVTDFRDYDRRLTYGVQGGLGMAVMFSRMEIHLNAQVKWGWGTFWNPDYNSPYYYRFGYPLDGAVTLGVYYQITPRYGHTRGQLRRMAKKMVREQENQVQ